MKVGYYPGCSLHSTGSDYGLSTEAVCRSLHIELAEIPDWNCCGATPAHSTNEFLAKALSLRNLTLAEQMGLDMVVPCTGCYNASRQAHGFIERGTPAAREVSIEVAAVMGQKYLGSLRIMHLLDFFSQPEVLEKLQASIVKPLTGMEVVPYYGCLMVRPIDDVAFDDPEQPQKLDRLLTALGAEVKPWSYKTECCGASLAIARPEVVADLSGKLVQQARRAGARAMVTACPLCQANVDTRTVNLGMPILYFTELIAAALGLPGQERWLGKHIIDPMPFMTGGEMKS